MGGTHDHLPEVPLCRDHHRSLHAGEWAFSIQGAWYVGTKGGDFRSPVALDNLALDKRYWEVEKLAAEWHAADKAAVVCYQAQCQVAWAIKERIEWMPEWWIEAAKQLTKNEDRPVAWQTVYDRVRSWQTFELRLGGEAAWGDVYLLGEKARQAVCAHDNPQWALDTAVVARLGGSTVAQVVRLLKGGDSDEPKTERCTCPDCGTEHRKGD
jgi:hypothetical protein